MLKSLLRILIALTFILLLGFGLLFYTNMLTGGKTFGTIAGKLQASGNSTLFYLTGPKVEAPWLNGYDLHTGYFGSGAGVTVYENWRYDYSGTLMVPKISLQRRLGTGAWVDVVTNVPFDKAKDLQATAPVYKVPSNQRSVKVGYRYVSRAYATADGRVKNTSYSSMITVTYENQNKYTGLAKTIYTMMKPYCPASAVHVGNPGDSQYKHEAGDYTQGMLLIHVNPLIGSRYGTADKRTVALHECAHERQFLNYGASAIGWQQMRAAAAVTFKNDVAPAGKNQRSGSTEDLPFDPVEHAADCAAYAVNPAGYLGYGGYCNPQELRVAAALLHGKQFPTG